MPGQYMPKIHPSVSNINATIVADKKSRWVDAPLANGPVTALESAKWLIGVAIRANAANEV